MHDDSQFLKAKERAGNKCHPVGQAGKQGRKDL